VEDREFLGERLARWQASFLANALLFLAAGHDVAKHADLLRKQAL
jgi:hypothetical protein